MTPILRSCRLRTLRLLEGLVKEVCCALLTCTAFVFTSRTRDDSTAGLSHWGIICQEFFRKDLGGFGGYGMTVKNLTDHYNSIPGGIHAHVIMPQDLGLVKAPEVRMIHNAEALLLPSLARLILHPIRFVRKLAALRPRFFLTIDYLLRYEYVLWAAPRTPVILYIRDPRSREVWETISTVPQETAANFRTSKKELVGIASQHAASFRRLQRWSRWTGRAIIFATNADFLTARAQSEFRLASLTPYYLPNPLPLPEVADTTYAPQPMLLALGRLDPQKRPWVIFELAARMPHVTFVVGGQSRFPELLGSAYEQYRTLPNLQFAGVVEGQRKDELLRNCWGLINTSIHEGLPVSFLEAFSYGKCVVSCLDPAGLVARFGYFAGVSTGEGLDETTLAAFQRSIGELLYDEEARRHKGLLARAYVKEHHSFARFESRFSEIIQKEHLL